MPNDRPDSPAGPVAGRAAAGRPLTEPHPSRLAPDHPDRDRILAAHADAVARGEAGYLDPATGLFVLTSAYLLDRSTCCETGCRHCPYLE